VRSIGWTVHLAGGRAGEQKTGVTAGKSITEGTTCSTYTNCLENAGQPGAPQVTVRRECPTMPNDRVCMKSTGAVFSPVDLLGSLCLYWFCFRSASRSMSHFGSMFGLKPRWSREQRDVSCRYRPESHSSVCQTRRPARPIHQSHQTVSDCLVWAPESSAPASPEFLFFFIAR
jgi:hypothetical protein